MARSYPERERADELSGQMVARPLARGEGWSLSEFKCHSGPGDRPYEERHQGFTIAAVLSGRFTYRCERDSGLLVPGALLLGSSGRCFRCGHEHGIGDTCVSLNIRDDLFGEVAATAAGGSGFVFGASSLPPSRALLPLVSRLEAANSGADFGDLEEFVWLAVTRVVATISGRSDAQKTPNARELRRIAEAIRRIENDPAGRHGLERLSAAAGMSRHHFLRMFRRVVGATPHQYVLHTRLRRAAHRLANSRQSVLSIALDCGFGDLSTFNRRFREIFGASPRHFRARL